MKMGDQKDGICEAPRSTEVPPNFASVEASVLDEIVREKKNTHEEDGSAPEDRIMAVFNKIHELLMDNDRDVRKVMESQGKQIKGLLELAAENCKVIALLWEDYAARCKGEAMVADVEMKKQRSVGCSSTRRGNVTYASSTKQRTRKKGDQPTREVEAVIRNAESILRNIRGEFEDPVKSSKCSAKGKKHARTSKVVYKKGTPRQPLNVVKRKLDYWSGDDGVGGLGSNKIQQEVLKSPEHVDVVVPGFVELCELPLWLDLSFYPPTGMNLSTLELVVVAYVFAPDLDKKEILVPNDHCLGDRKAFWTLRPGKEVVDDVLNLVATMLTDQRTENTWWLPTTFSQIALNPTTYCKESLEYVERRYMGPVDDITKIYIPMYTEGHWYLMVVDMCNQNLIYLDSLKDDKFYDQRVGQMQFVALFLHTMLRGRRFYKKKN
ncbi:hypothetical protein HN51_025997 [Arachis hypogaea]|uniref:uncharacterized protein isoform X1 n=1 Tax=Arachis hypogaea TaxID=3818 RepID=UPI000DED1E8B|nr:uncharacterized protein LOC112703201 isoform X1 [Arachis hypogaea]